MTFAYLASLDCSRAAELGFTTVQVSASGQPTFSVNLASLSYETGDTLGTCTVFNHVPFGLALTVGQDRAESTAMNMAYSSYSIGSALMEALNDAADTAGAAVTVTIGLNTTTLQYTFTFSPAASIQFGNTATANLFGFTGNQSSTTTHTSTITPWGIIRPVLTDVSEPTTNYEPEGISSQAVSAGNAVVGLSRSVAPIYRDWTQQYESKEKTLRLSASASHPFTHQELFEISRSSVPFVVMDGFGGTAQEVFFFRADASAWKCERATASNDAQFHVQYRAVVAGTVTFEL